jgi:predicted Zn-dependent peptidase
VALLTALETPGGRIERTARQLLAWNRIVGGDEIVERVDAVTLDQVREAGRRLVAGPLTLAAIGPIGGLPAARTIAEGLRLSAA